MKKLIFGFALLFLAIPCQARIITVDANGSAEFDNIQAAIDNSNDGDTIIVRDGTYTGGGNRDIDFNGLAITVQSTGPNDPCIVAATIIDCNGGWFDNHRGFYFHSGEDANSVVEGFTITNGFAVAGGGIYCNGASPTITNNVITNNTATSMTITPSSRGGGICCIDSSAIIINNLIASNHVRGWGGGVWSDSAFIINNTIANNHCNSASFEETSVGGIYCTDSSSVVNTIIWGNTGNHPPKQIDGCTNVTYCDIQDGWPGLGNIDVDPRFADPCNFDYHLQSQEGRWDPNQNDWVYDANTSPCIDAGNPGCPLGDEPNDPNNIRINMGAYGGTAEASKTPANWRSIADLTNDWTVDFNDLAAFVDYWLETGECIPSDLNRSQAVDFSDFAIFADNWLQMSLKANLLAHWKLNDNAANPIVKDAVGENDGVYTDSGGLLNTDTGSVAGKFGTALDFDDLQGDYVNFGKDESLLAIKKGWNKYASNPVLTTAGDSFASFFKDGSTYYAWSGTSTVVYRHSSADGKNWGSRTACTGLGADASVASVWKEGSTWHMMYRKGGGAYTVINYATSSDGLAWTDHGTKISQGSAGQWDYNMNLDPWGVIKVGSTYYLWYNTIGTGRKTGLATTTDLSGAWTKDENNPIFGSGYFCAWCFKYGDYYYLAIPHYTSGPNPDYHAEIELYKDSSPTFYSGSREFVRIVATVSPGAGIWDEECLDTPCILTDTVERNTYAASDGELWMYYAGENDESGSVWKTGMTIEANPLSALRKRGLTIAFWMKHVNPTNGVCIISWGETGGRFGWWIANRAGDYGNGNLLFGCYESFVETRQDADNDWNDGEWHFVVCAWGGIDESTAKIYVDNVLQTIYLVGNPFAISVTEEELCLGAHLDDGTAERFFDGTFDNVMLFDKVLSTAEKSYLWNSGDGRESVPDLAKCSLVGRSFAGR